MSIITQSQASKLAGVSRVAILKQSRKDPMPLFFVSQAGKLKVDDDHIDFQAYVLKKKQGPKKSDTTSRVKKVFLSKNKVLEIKDGAKKLKSIISAREGGAVDVITKALPSAIAPLLETAERLKADKIKEAKNKNIAYIEERIKGDISEMVIDRNMSRDDVIAVQELYRAKKLREEVLMKELQRREREHELIDVAMGSFLFQGFIDQIGVELFLIPAKQSPNLESLYRGGQGIKAQQLLKREFSGMLEKVAKEQARALLQWKKGK